MKNKLWLFLMLCIVLACSLPHTTNDVFPVYPLDGTIISIYIPGTQWLSFEWSNPCQYEV